MTWLTLAVWILVTLLALLAARMPLPSLGAQALVLLVGLGLTIAFVTGQSHAFAWVAFGLACLAVPLASAGAWTLVQDESVLVAGTKPYIKEGAAGLLGLELPFLFPTIVFTLWIAILR
jgi:hypothetical protein